MGRGDASAQLDDLMLTGPGIFCQTVHGLGGVGKTELALQYAHRWRHRYPVRWWVTADTPAAVESGLAALTARLYPELALTATTGEAAAWAIGWLQNQARWLLVLDNVERRSDVEPLLAQLDNGHVLITTRRDVGWESIVDRCMRLGILDRECAVQLLLERAEQSDQSTAAVLAEELGYLPLALQQAAGYLRRTHVRMSSYLDRLRGQPATVLQVAVEGDQTERAVAQVWLVTLDRLSNEQPVAVDLLRILSCYAPDDVPRDMLSGYADEVGVVDDGLSALASYNLVTLTETTVSTHRLLQATVRSDMQGHFDTDSSEIDDGRQESTWRRVLDRALALLDRARPSHNLSVTVDSWPQWRALAPHVESLARHIPGRSEQRSFVYLLGQLGFYYYTQAKYSQAIALERRALEIGETVLPAGHPDLALLLNNLAGTLAALAEPEEALPLQRRALKISEAALPAGHPAIAMCLNYLAHTLGDLGRAEEALPLQWRALEISEAALPAGHPDIALRLNNLGSTLGVLGRAEEALPLQWRALEISEAALPAGHPYIALRLNNLAHTLGVLGRAEEALPLQRRALEISEAALPAGHPYIALRLNSLAHTLAVLGRAQEALPLQRRLVQLRQLVQHERFGARDPN
ncbi:FxSxx-COOH system tetratricopeptide repeat protein [Micromonospora arborensis]|uniref:FxSxx-COOH system tetratricopeptide repeat protein n=1 Tax=Micromonospora arborensis TaxID=2116518 RepID=UPI003722DD2B